MQSLQPQKDPLNLLLTLLLCLSSQAGVTAAPGSDAPDPPAGEQAPDPGEKASAENVADPMLNDDEQELVTALFGANCSLCHGENGESTNSRLNLVDETWFHGGSLEQIVRTIREGIPDTKMVAKAGELEDDQMVLLARYVRQLSLEMHDKTAEPERRAATELTNRVVSQLPPGEQGEVITTGNLVDHYIFGKMEQDGVPHAGLCSDLEFYRRVHLDLWGRIPEAEDVRKFLADKSPDRRDELIREMLWIEPEAFKPLPGKEAKKKKDYKNYDDPSLVDPAFISKWRYFFEDLFRNKYTYAGVHFFNTAEGFRNYLELFLKYDLPYDYFVRDMLTASGLSGKNSGPTGYLIRNAVDGADGPNHEDTCDEIAIHATQDFLGVNLNCISCHDGANHLEKTNLWLTQRKREEFWRQAAFFADTRIFKGSSEKRDYVLTDGPTLREAGGWRQSAGYQMDSKSSIRVPRNISVKLEPEFMLTKEKPEKSRNLREEFARMVTSEFQFAKVIVNLIWSRLMTVGIVDPPLDWDLARQDPDNPPPAPWTIQPSHPELLEALARDFQKKNYDLRNLMRTICESRAYQLSSKFEGEYKKEWDRYYARRMVRRLTSEEVYDALAKATNVFGHGRPQSQDLPPEYTSQWSGYAMDLPGPLKETQFCDEDLKEFLFFFNRSDRETKWPATNASVLQASLMMYSNLVLKKLRASTEGSRTGSLLQKHPPDTWQEQANVRKLVEEVYLCTLTRLPTDEEMTISQAHLVDHQEKGLENLQWALLNKLEFLVNY